MMDLDQYIAEEALIDLQTKTIHGCPCKQIQLLESTGRQLSARLKKVIAENEEFREIIKEFQQLAQVGE